MKGGKQPGAGRPKGSVNAATKQAKQVIADVAESLGGAERLKEWVLTDPKNEAVFWSNIYTKLTPLQLTGDSESPIHVTHGISESAQSLIDSITGR